MDMIIWTSDERIAADVIAKQSPYWVRSVHVYLRDTGELIDEFIDDDEELAVLRP